MVNLTKENQFDPVLLGSRGLRQEFNSGTRKFDFGKDHNKLFVVTRKKATFICKGDPAAFIYFEVPDPSEFIRHALEVRDILSLEAKTAREIETKRKKALEAIDPDQTAKDAEAAKAESLRTIAAREEKKQKLRDAIGYGKKGEYKPARKDGVVIEPEVEIELDEAHGNEKTDDSPDPEVEVERSEPLTLQTMEWDDVKVVAKKYDIKIVGPKDDIIKLIEEAIALEESG